MERRIHFAIGQVYGWRSVAALLILAPGTLAHSSCLGFGDLNVVDHG